MKFDELFLWAMDNQIGIQIYTTPLNYRHPQNKENQLYHARFSGNNGTDSVHQELQAINPEELLRVCEFSLQKLYINMTMKKPRKKKA